MGATEAERKAVWFGLFVVGCFVAPLFLLGENAHIRVHDNLDSNLAWYRVLHRSGTWFGSLDAVVPQVIGGLPRNAFGTEFSGIVALHAVLPPMAAYAISQTITRVFAFLGMVWLLRDHWATDKDAWPIRVGVALAFALTPFWPSGMLSTLGQPLALWAFLHIRRGTARWTHWTAITLLPLYASFVLGFFFFLAAMYALWLWDAAAKRQRNWAFLGAVVYMTVLFLGVEYRLVLSLLFADEPTSRNEFVSSRLSFERTVRLAAKNFVLGHNHVRTVHAAVALPIAWIVLCLALARSEWRADPAGRRFLALFALNAALSVWYAFWFYEGWQPLKERFALLNTFNFARFHFLRPMIVYAGFALAALLLWRRGGRNGRRLACVAVAAQLAVLCAFNEEIEYRDKPSFGEFYAEEQFRDIAAYIGRPLSSYRVASVGLHPAIAQYNGFYTVDTYNNFYPLEYKHRFRRIIAKELDKSEKLRTYFDTWGNRCYVFVAELGKKYDYGKRSKKRIRRLELDVEAFRALGGAYLFSAVPIENAEDNGLALLRAFDHPRSAWKVYVYEARAHTNGAKERGETAMAKPDDRSDNVAHLVEMTKDTIKNIHEAEDYLSEFGDEIPAKEKEDILAKNERRRESIAKFRREIKDEAHDH